MNFLNKFGPFVAIRRDRESRLQRKVVAIAGPNQEWVHCHNLSKGKAKDLEVVGFN